MVRLSRERVWTLVEPETKNRWGRRFESVVFALASLNVLAVVLASVNGLYERYATLFDGFLVASMALFTALYVVRLWAAAATSDDEESDGRVAFVREPMAVVDFVVISTFWLGVLFDVGQFARGLSRILWLARLFTIPWFVRSRGRFKRVLAAQREDLAIAFSGAGALVLVSSTLMYFVEGTVQPDAFSSIPDTFWWAVVTLTTVGYGDVVPVTPLGRLLGAVTMFGGVAFFALPSSILAAGFFAEREADRSRPEGTPTDRCPHCGEPLDPTRP